MGLYAFKSGEEHKFHLTCWSTDTSNWRCVQRL